MPLPLFVSYVISSFLYTLLSLVLDIFFYFEITFFMASLIVEPGISDPLQAN